MARIHAPSQYFLAECAVIFRLIQDGDCNGKGQARRNRAVEQSPARIILWRTERARGYAVSNVRTVLAG